MGERRKAIRYELFLPVAIEAPNENGPWSYQGKTLDISARGIYFTVGAELSAGMKISLSMRVPPELAGGMDVFILAIGTVLRVETRMEGALRNFGVPAAISRYEYFLDGIFDDSSRWLSFLGLRIEQ